MLAAGWFEDTKTGTPIKGVLVRIVDRDGNDLNISTESDNVGYFQFITDVLNPATNLFFHAYKNGYEPILIQPVYDGGALYELDPVDALPSAKEDTIWPTLITGGIFLVASYFLNSSSKRKVGDIGPGTQKIIMYGAGGAILYFGVLSPILKKLGILQSQESRELDNASADPASPWNPNYWKTVPNALILTQAAVNDFLYRISKAFGAFDDDEDIVMGIFKQLHTKTQVSYLADKFYSYMHADLLAYLRGGSWPNDRLSDGEVAELNDYVKQLPVK